MSNERTYGFAILGAGMVAEYHRQAIEANADIGARLVAVGHYNPDRFEAIAADFGAPCTTHGQLLSNPAVDIVCICTPSGQHADQAIAAAQAGKHVLVEKPMALNLDDADAMIETCSRERVKLGVVLQRRAEPLFRRVREAISGGDLGELTLGIVTIPYVRPQAYFEQAEWRGTWGMDGGGVLMNQGIHLVDLLIWYMGDPVDVQAYANTLHRDIEVEDTLAAALRFPNGALATITATTTTAPGFPHRVEIYGTGGGIQIEGESAGRWDLAEPALAKTEPAATSVATDAGAGGDPRGIKPTGHIAVFRDFLKALGEGRDPEIDGAEGRRSVATVLAVYEAAGLL
jgi:UDP-N-acetyl-2-amino-2-deoxyglucuronate dehydrogenase